VFSFSLCLQRWLAYLSFVGVVALACARGGCVQLQHNPYQLLEEYLSADAQLARKRDVTELCTALVAQAL